MITKLFPTLIYEGSLLKSKQLNQQILREVDVYRKEDKEGQEWSQKNYRGGYTSYNSLSQLHKISPTFLELNKKIDKHVKKYIRALDYNLSGRQLQMTTCWMNVMPQNTYHPLHIHPLCVISGTYYVQVPEGTSSLKIEDTKMGYIMSAPPRKNNNYYYHFKPKSGDLVLFESWIRHEVPPNPVAKERISISFNYEWL